MVTSNRRAKIIATLGPACDSPQQITEMIKAGADVLRVNTSHLTPQQATHIYQIIQQQKEQLDKDFALLVDLQGPKLRLGNITPTHLVTGQQIKFSEQVLDDTIHMPIPDLMQHIKSGDRIVLGDGAPTLQVTKIVGQEIHAQVNRAGDIRPRMGAALPDSNLQLPALTEQDREHLIAAADYADWFALSFVSSPSDIKQLRLALDELECPAKIMAKIERASALICLPEIIHDSDAVMVARGDLGVETGLASVPFIQEDIVQACIAQAKPAVIATQVMESMIHADLPTRAEAADVAQALVEGASALMLSAETATGDHPLLAVSTLGELITKVEPQLRLKPITVPAGLGWAGSLVRAADQLANDQDVKIILIPTNTGRTARLAANLGRQHVVALCTDPRVRSQLALERGITSIMWDGQHGEYLPVTVLETARAAGVVASKRRVVVAWSHEQPGQGAVQLVAALGN